MLLGEFECGHAIVAHYHRQRHAAHVAWRCVDLELAAIAETEHRAPELAKLRAHRRILRIDKEADQAAAQQTIVIDLAPLGRQTELLQARPVDVSGTGHERIAARLVVDQMLLDPVHAAHAGGDGLAHVGGGELRQRSQQLRRRQLAGAVGGGNRIGIDALLAFVELRERIRQRLLQFWRECEAVVTGAVRVRHHPARAALRFAQLQPRLRATDDAALLAHLRTVGVTHAHRDTPGLRGAGGRAQRQVALLLQAQRRGLAGAAIHIDLHQRHPGLVDETQERRLDRDRIGALRRDRVDQVGAGGVAARVRLQVGPHAVAERCLANVVLEHRQHRATLLVGDAVERTLDFGEVVDRLADAARAGEAVDAHRAQTAFENAAVGMRFGPQLAVDLVAHPGRERLVEPQVVPPLHRDQVTEPLVRELVRADAPETLAFAHRRILVREHQAVAVDDQAGVLHRAGGKVGRGDVVELVEWVWRAEIVLQRFHYRRRIGQRIRHATTLPLGGDATQRDRVFT